MPTKYPSILGLPVVGRIKITPLEGTPDVQ